LIDEFHEAGAAVVPGDGDVVRLALGHARRMVPTPTRKTSFTEIAASGPSS
jgi:hypothetical protein